jgi:5-methylcytosine-specific restriction endonuclease McrA
MSARRNVAEPQDTQEIAQEHHTAHEWQKKFFGMGACCYYCQKPLKLREASKDHLRPRCRGGSDVIRNIVPSCLVCNQMKAWRTESEFYAARPSFAKKKQATRSIYKPNELISLEERVNEPGLLKRVVAERDGNVSWFWRNPPPSSKRLA